MEYLLRGILIGLLFGLPVGAVGAWRAGNDIDSRADGRRAAFPADLCAVCRRAQLFRFAGRRGNRTGQKKRGMTLDLHQAICYFTGG